MLIFEQIFTSLSGYHIFFFQIALKFPKSSHLLKYASAAIRLSTKLTTASQYLRKYLKIKSCS